MVTVPKFLRTGRLPTLPAFQHLKPPATVEAEALREAFRKAHPEVEDVVNDPRLLNRLYGLIPDWVDVPPTEEECFE